MKKRILSLAMACVIALPFASAVFAAPKADEEFTRDWLGASFVTSVVTPNDYIGEAGIGNLQFWGEPFTGTFSVFMVEDSVSELVIHNYTTSRTKEFYSWEPGGVSHPSVAMSDSGVEMSSSFGWFANSSGTKEDPFIYGLTTAFPDRLMPQMYVYFLASTPDAETDDLGWTGYSGIVFTRTQIEEFKRSGNLPPVMSFGDPQEDLSANLDLTELKALLNNYNLPTPVVSPTASVVSANGEVKSFEAYSIDGNNYFKLRDLAMALTGGNKQFEVGYDDASKAITITSNTPYTVMGGELLEGDGSAKAAEPTASKIYLDGKELDLTAYNIGGSNFFKLRDVMKAVDIFVGYDDVTKAIVLDASRSYVD